MILATDLDGTFLAGDPENRLKLYQLISTHPDMTLVFVTGRGLESVLPLLSDPTLPQPDYIICDVGCTVVDGGSQQPVGGIQAEIEQYWPGEHAVEDALAGFADCAARKYPRKGVAPFCANPKR